MSDDSNKTTNPKKQGWKIIKKLSVQSVKQPAWKAKPSHTKVRGFQACRGCSILWVEDSGFRVRVVKGLGLMR